MSRKEKVLECLSTGITRERGSNCSASVDPTQKNMKQVFFLPPVDTVKTMAAFRWALSNIMKRYYNGRLLD